MKLRSTGYRKASANVSHRTLSMIQKHPHKPRTRPVVNLEHVIALADVLATPEPAQEATTITPNEMTLAKKQAAIVFKQQLANR